MGKVVNSYSSKDSGISAVTIQNRYGRFTGFAACHPDDVDNFSNFAGERYAEIRATAQFAKFRYKQEKIKLKAIKNLLNDINYLSFEHSKDTDKIIRKIKLKIRDYSQSAEDWKNLYHYLNEQVAIQDKNREKILLRAKKNN